MNLSAVLLLLVTVGWGTTFPLLKSLATDLNCVEISNPAVPGLCCDCRHAVPASSCAAQCVGRQDCRHLMEPVFAALFGWLWLKELLGWRGLAGGALVIAALILSEIRATSSANSI